jgi:hypothetical protein
VEVVPTYKYPTPLLWIYTWVDYSKKYGIGYVLCDKSTGVFFKDGSNMIADELCDNISYRGKQDRDFKMFNILNTEPELKKKVAVLKHFQTYFQ